MENLLKNMDFSGALFSDKGEEIKQYYHGFQETEKKYPINRHTQFNLASLSKMFTAVMTFQLIEKEQLQLEDKITKWVKAKHYPEVTVAQLLTHTSGIPDYIAAEPITSVEEYVDESLPQFEPNEQWSYSNSNYVLLAKIIEGVSGLSYEQYLQQWIAKPLHLTSLTTKPLSQYEAQAQTYDYEGRRYIKAAEDPYLNKLQKYNNVFGDGGIYGTVEEVAKFLIAFLQGRLINKERVKFMLTPTKVADYYSYGFLVQEEWAGHTGGWVGCSAQAFIHTKTEEVVVLATNQEVFPQYELEMMDYFIGKQDTMEAPKHLEILPLTNEDDISGQYELEDGLGTRFFIEKDGLFMITLEHQLSIPLFKIGESNYWLRNSTSYLDVENHLFLDGGMEVPYRKVD